MCSTTNLYFHDIETSMDSIPHQTFHSAIKTKGREISKNSFSCFFSSPFCMSQKVLQQLRIKKVFESVRKNLANNGFTCSIRRGMISTGHPYFIHHRPYPYVHSPSNYLMRMSWFFFRFSLPHREGRHFR